MAEVSRGPILLWQTRILHRGHYAICGWSGADDRSEHPGRPVGTAGNRTLTSRHSVIRKVSLNELDSGTVFVPVDENGNFLVDEHGNLVEDWLNGGPFGPEEAQLGTIDEVTGSAIPMSWMEQITENPALNATEIWEIYNFTADAHPIHVHEVMFEVLDRQMMDAPFTSRAPEAWETGTERIPSSPIRVR